MYFEFPRIEPTLLEFKRRIGTRSFMSFKRVSVSGQGTAVGRVRPLVSTKRFELMKLISCIRIYRISHDRDHISQPQSQGNESQGHQSVTVGVSRNIKEVGLTSILDRGKIVF